MDQVIKIFGYYDVDPEILEAELDATKDERMLSLGFKQIYNRFIKCIKTGHLEIVDHENIPTFKVNLREPTNGKDSQSITFMPRGYYNDRLERNLPDDCNSTTRNITMIASMIQKPVDWVEKLKVHDRSLCEVIGHFFSAM
jgi:hypothetical protein